MIYPSPDKLDRTGSKYALVIVAAKRARQIKDGARKLVDSASSNPLTVALEEMSEGALIPLQVGEPERLPDMVSLGPVLQGLVASSDADDLDDIALRSAASALRSARAATLTDDDVDAHILLGDDHDDDDVLVSGGAAEDAMMSSAAVELGEVADDVAEADESEESEDEEEADAAIVEEEEPAPDDAATGDVEE